MSQFKIEKQSLESQLLQLKAEREIISTKELEISKNLSQMTSIKNDIGRMVIQDSLKARERETIEKLNQDNTLLCNNMESQRMSVIQSYMLILID